jgi:methionyl-tRNA formyltransferase
MDRKTVVVLGKGELAIRVSRWFLASDDYRLLYVIPVLPEPAWAPSLTETMFQERVLLLDRPQSFGLPHADLAVSVYYDKILKQDFLRRFDKVINIHNAPLPRYRGMSPINWALKNGECQHGVTIHQVDEGIDDGPIIAQSMFCIWPEHDEVRDVYERCIEEGWQLFQRTMPELWTIDPIPQDEGRATYHTARESTPDALGDRYSWTRAYSRMMMEAKR